MTTLAPPAGPRTKGTVLFVPGAPGTGTKRTVPFVPPSVPDHASLTGLRLFTSPDGPPPERSHGWLVDAAQQVGLLGRGGAAFPVATKLRAVPRGARVLANGSEGEPASWKDRQLMRHRPDLVIGGVQLVGKALASPEIVIAVNDAESADALTRQAGEWGAQVEIREVDYGFVGGEIGALVNGLNGRRAVPDGRRRLPHIRGLGDQPTYASNVETFARLGELARLGPEEYATLGSAREPGTSLVTRHWDGTIDVLEVTNGIRLGEIMPAGVGAILVGGYHGTWTTRTDLVLDRAWLRGQGIGWGAGVLAALPNDTCPVGEVARVARWLAGQSARQCGPCLFGLDAIAGDLADLARAEPVDLARLRNRLALAPGRGACAHPTGVAGFVVSALTAFADEVAHHAAGKLCGRPVRGALPIGETP